MKHNKNLSILVLALVISNIGCSNKASQALNTTISQSTGLAFTPSMYLECDADVNPLCNQTTRNQRCTGSQSEIQAFAVITKNSCSNMSTDYLAKGSDGMMCNSYGCTGGILRLTDSNNQTIDQMPAGNANICVFIDLSCDGRLSAQDLFQQRTINIQDDLAEIEILEWNQL